MFDLFKKSGAEIFFSKRIKNTNELPLKPFLSIQKHTDEIFIIKTRYDISKSEIADAVITDITNLAIGIKTADCVPVLIYDPVKKIIAAVHSGWRGTAKKIVEKTIFKMSEIYGTKPADLIVAIGPAICGKCYSVGKDVIDELSRITELKPKTEGDRFFVDLRKINFNMIVKIGVNEKNIFIHPDCTYCKNDIYQSYRYHKNTLSFQISYIMIKYD